MVQALVSDCLKQILPTIQARGDLTLARNAELSHSHSRRDIVTLTRHFENLMCLQSNTLAN